MALAVEIKTYTKRLHKMRHEPLQKEAFVEALAALNDPDIAAIIAPLITDASEKNRLFAAQAMNTFPDARFLHTITKGLHAKQSDSVKILLLQALAKTDSKKGLHHFLGHLEDPSEPVRSASMEVLKGHLELVPELTKLLRHARPSDQLQIVKTLSMMGDKNAIAALMETMATTSGPLQDEAIRALGELRASGAVDSLLSRLADPLTQPHTRRACAEALGHIGDPRANGVLLQILEDSVKFAEAGETLDTSLMVRVVESLGEQAEKKALRAMADLFRFTNDKRLRAALTGALGQVADYETVRLLIANY